MLKASWGGGLDEVAARFRASHARANTMAFEFVADVSMNVIADAQRNFEGSHSRREPRVPNTSMKPNVVTGELKRSIRGSGVVQLGPGRFENTVGPTKLYGRRVEMGFKGTDSKGRQYNQPAYPYFGPAVKKNRVLAQRRAETAFQWAWLLS